MLTIVDFFTKSEAIVPPIVGTLRNWEDYVSCDDTKVFDAKLTVVRETRRLKAKVYLQVRRIVSRLGILLLFERDCVRKTLRGGNYRVKRLARGRCNLKALNLITVSRVCFL